MNVTKKSSITLSDQHKKSIFPYIKNSYFLCMEKAIELSRKTSIPRCMVVSDLGGMHKVPCVPDSDLKELGIAIKYNFCFHVNFYPY